MKKLETLASRNFFRIVLSAILLSLFINLAVGLFLNKQIFDVLHKDIQPDIGREGLELSQSVLVDSILAIVQSYYVDAERVGNAAILKQTVDSLTLNPDVKVTEDGRSYHLRYKDDSEAYEMRWSDSMSYRALLSSFLGLAGYLDSRVKNVMGRHDGELPKGAEMVLEAMLTALDAHSSLLSPSSYRELKQGTEGAFGGLGVLVGIRDQLLTVIKPLPKSPAVRAGIKRNDKILTINGKSTFGYSLDDLVEYMRGAPGTLVDVDLLKEGDISPKVLSLRREIIKVDSVSAKDIVTKDNHTFLHLTIETFSSRTSDEVLNAMKKFRQKHGGLLAGLVLDLRSNPGGLLEQAVGVADIFLKSGTIVTTRGRKKEVESARPDSYQNDFPMVVLINGESASASEIVAGALQDHGRAIIVGEPSFGKGSVQTIFELPNEQALKLTIARYYTPLGRSIQNVGIFPDVWLQPIYNETRNQNLLGMFRYKNELFLKNHLEAVSEQHPGLSAKSFTQAAFKEFYLNPLPHKDAIDQEEKPDPEMRASLAILDRATETYGELLPESARRASHWLALSSKSLKKTFQAVNDETGRWLHERFDIDWTEDPKPAVTDFETIQVKADTDAVMEVLQGTEIEIPWVLTNHGEKPVYRVSVYGGANTMGLENAEVLVGKVNSNQTVRGKFKFKIPSYVEIGHLPMVLGLAIDSVAKRTVPAALTLRVGKKSQTKLRTEVELVDEKGGNLTGVLEANENAKVRLRIFNDSEIEARNLKASLQNLSGKQVSLVPKENKAGSIEAWGSLDLLFDIKANQKIISKKLDLGVALESVDLLDPVYESVHVPAAPNDLKAGTTGAMAH